MSFRSLGKALDCFGLSILFENKRFGEVDEQIACENNKEGLANRTTNTDLEDDRHQISDEKKEVGEVKNPQARSAFAFVFDFSIAGREPFGEDQDEEIDGQSEMVHRIQHLEVVSNDRDHVVHAESCEGSWHFKVLLGPEGESGGQRKRHLHPRKSKLFDQGKKSFFLSVR